MKVLLIYPKTPEDNFWSFKYIMRFLRQKAAFPPLGLLTVAALMPISFEKRLIDLNVRELKDRDILWADMIFIGGMIVQQSSAKEIIERCKKLSKDKKVVAGGPLFTTKYNEDDFSLVDHFVLNEAEITLPLFLKDLKENNAQRIYTSEIRPELSLTPIPLWYLINPKDYVTIPVQFSRGCPFNCEFCDIIIMNGQIQRTKCPKQFLVELEYLYNMGWRNKAVFIVDDNFIGNKAKTKELLQELIKWNKEHDFPFTFLTEASVNLSDDDELLDLMVAANFSKVFLGLETPNEASLKECNKKQNSDRNIKEAINKIHRHGIQVMGGFIVGFDSDEADIFEKQFTFIQQIGVVVAMVVPLMALPGTRLEKRLKAEKRLSESNIQVMGGDTNFEPMMGKKVLMDGYKKLVKKLFSSKNYYKRVFTFLKNYKHTAKEHGISRDDFVTFLKSVLYIGILSRESPHYWWLIMKIIFIGRINSLPVAIEQVIEGRHFKKVASKIRKG